MIPWLEPDTPFPDTDQALTEADGAPGLLAAGADLSPNRLLDAYKNGIFPWFSDNQPVLWWSTDPRMVLQIDDFHISRSLTKTLKKIDSSMRNGGQWTLRFDSAFYDVIHACAQPRDGSDGTWISNQIIEGYCALHKMGHAHSSELWLDNQLVAGAYGVSIGKMFYGESMFALVPDGSKVALAYLVDFLRHHGVKMIDCQQQTSHLASLGAKPIRRAEFIALMKTAIAEPDIQNWQPRQLFAEGTHDKSAGFSVGLSSI
jgi:leucyl/phenylalanyl-tRNA--protein transferase